MIKKIQIKHFIKGNSLKYRITVSFPDLLCPHCKQQDKGYEGREKNLASVAQAANELTIITATFKELLPELRSLLSSICYITIYIYIHTYMPLTTHTLRFPGVSNLLNAGKSDLKVLLAFIIPKTLYQVSG